MRDKILELKVDTTQVLRDNFDAVYLTEHDADQLLTLISEEIEKVENPHPHFQGESLVYGSSSEAFEQCRQKMLALLR